MTRRLATLALGAALLVLVARVQAQSGFRYVSATDPTCGGHAPCYATIQAALDAAQPGEVVQVQAGSYVEQVNVQGKNDTAGATEADRIVVQADPAAPLGSVVLHGAVTQCTNGFAIRFQQSKFVTIRGLTITGAGGAAISLQGGINQNQAIHIERNRIFGNGAPSCDGGITIARNNPDTLVANNLVYANGRDGISTIDAVGGPHWIVGNTVHGNGWNGVNITRSHDVFLVNNSITGNGTATGSTGGRFGVKREDSTNPDPTGIQLLNNLVCGNRLGEIDGPALDATDAGNLTPTGTEGPGVAASPGCGTASTVYVHVAGADGLLDTADDDFTLAAGSPAIDSGLDPRTLGLSTAFNPIFEADFAGPAARPRNGSGAATARFDMGALEKAVPDTTAPEITFQAPPAGAFVRQSVSVQAQATDGGSGVASLALTTDSQSLSATLSPALPPPAPSVTATATWNTTAVPDGAHTLGATATDQAGNSNSVTRAVIVDNTPPETTIQTGPSGEITEATATFTFTGSDFLTPAGSLVFAWRLDGDAFGAFTGATSATVSGLTDGPHTFEVKARDLAGNEDLTPATRSFTVRFGPSIAAVAPSSGPIGTLVTITGTSFEPGATSVAFNGLAAVVRTVTATAITTTVPVGATSGPLVVATSRGTASVPFTVTLTGDFALAAAPAAARAIAGDQAAVSIGASGTGTLTSLVSLTVSPAVSGITPGFGSPFVAPGASTSLTLQVASTVAPGTYAFTVTGEAQVDGRAVTRSAGFTLEVLPPDTTAVTGRIMTAEGIPQPIPGVTVTLGTAFVLTDAGGNFVLLAPPGGQNLLFVDGRTASTPQAQYPIVEVKVTVSGTGPTRVPFTIYLPTLDTGNAITLPLDGAGFTTQEVKATTPRIPGLVVTIPQGTRIVGPDGNPVAQLVITPVPVDRSPMPFPPGKVAPLLFAINPGGAVPSQPLPISFPNVTEAAPGTTADMIYFDLAVGDWNTWGTGTVSADGTQVVSDPGVGLPRLAWHWWDVLRTGLKKVWKFLTGGDPVDLATGAFTVDKTDLLLPGRLPVSIRRSYRSDDTRAGFFGIGWNLGVYDSRLTSDGATLNLITADQNRFQLRPDGAGRWTSPESVLLGAVVTQLAGEFNFQIRYKDGTVHRYDRIIGFANTAGLAAITDRNGNTLTITRSSLPNPNRFGLVTRVTEPAGRAIDLTYDLAGRIAQISDPLGRTVRYTYDAQGRLETVTDPAGGLTRYAYDAQHRIVSITDPRNITYLTNEYDAAGRVVRQTQADGGVWTFDYTVLGDVITATRVTNPRGHATTHAFNTLGFPVATTDALGRTTTFDYAPGSNLLTATTDPLGRTTRVAYDATGNVAAITDPAQNTRTFTYEPAFNKLASITDPPAPSPSDPLPHVTQFRYDAQGNLTTIVDPRGTETTLTYDAAGQPLTIADPLGHTTTLTYDAHGNLATTTDPLGNTTSLHYDAVGRRIRRTDPRGHASQFAYDPLNQVTLITDAIGGLTRLSWDPNGNALGVTDARGGVTSFAYDAMDRAVTRTDPLLRSETYEHDPNGNRIRVTDRRGQVTNSTYDPVDRLIGVTYADASTTTYTYDAGNRLSQVADSLGGTIVFTYDSLDRLSTETTAQGTVAYAYDAVGRRTSLSVPGQTPVTYAYDSASRLLTITQGTSLVSIAYDDANRRTRLTLPNGVATDYAYDPASRLTGLTYTRDALTLGTLTYAYDAAGQRTRVGGSWARTGLPAPMPGATYDAANQQLTFGDQTLTYDLNGNLTSDGTQTYTWDPRNRLSALTGPVAATFTYDGSGRRLRKTIDGTPTDFLYDRLNLVREVQGAAVTDLLTGLAIDEHFVRSDAAGAASFLTDALGSTVALTDAGGAIQTEYTYEPFGAVAVSGAPSASALQFTGRENDATGLYYYRARYYHPGLQRFISEDRLGFAGGDPNLYAYVGNNPVSFRDPTGNIAIAAPVVIGGAAIVALWLASPQGQQAVRDAVEGAQQFAETAIESLQSLMGRRQRETGLENISDEEISRRARDKSIPWEERRRYIAEDKFREKRNINKERGGPNKFSGLNLIELAPPLELTAPDPINLSGRKDR